MVIFTILFRWYARKRYRYHSKYLPLSECPVMPEQTEEERKKLDEMYLHPGS